MLKRFFDLTVALVLLIVLSPVILTTALAVWWNFSRPILFVQTRPGRNAQLFNLYKFRTMLDANDPNGNPLPDADRLTSFGKLLRTTSLDELPSLLNVIRGNMSLVGPRPLLLDYIPIYTKRQARRHEVRPGITGWAQVNGRNALSWEEKFEYDIWYVDHHSLALDLRILFMTIVKVLAREDINHDGHSTAPKFTGSDHPN